MTQAVVTAQHGGADYSGTFRNKIINGDMRIDQRNAGVSGTGNNNYTLDRWEYFGSQTSKGTWQQNAGSVTPPAGFTNYWGFTSSSAYTVGAAESFQLTQHIEGYNIYDLAWGTASAKAVTLSFWVRSSLTGTFGGVLNPTGNLRAYPFTYTIPSANTWTYISIPIPGDTSGTWSSDNSRGIALRFTLGVGSTYSATANSWTGTSNIFGATGAISVVGTNAATWYITGVQLEVGTQATPFERRHYGMEFQLCQRYFQKHTGGGNARHFIAGNGNNTSFPTCFLKTTMRSTPSFSYSALSHFTSEGLSGGQATPTGLNINAASTDSVTISVTCTSGINAGGAHLFGSNAAAWTAFEAEL